MNDLQKYAHFKNSVTATVLMIYLLGFMFVGYGSWEMSWKEAGNPPLSQDAFITTCYSSWIYSHVIFNQKHSYGIRIIRVLHQSMDLPKQMKST